MNTQSQTTLILGGNGKTGRRVADRFRGILDGHNARLTDGVERALGRQPRDFRDYARAVAAGREP